ncbi:MAG: DUF2262 domain-containing protein [Planctomycetaceae bacterium]
MRVSADELILGIQEVVDSGATFSGAPVEIEGVTRRFNQTIYRTSKPFDVLKVLWGAWRQPGEALTESNVAVFYAVAKGFNQLFPTGTHQRCRVVFGKGTFSRAPFAAVVEVLTPSPLDVDIQRAIDEFTMPSRVVSERVGEFEYQERKDRYMTMAKWMGEDVEVHLDANDMSGCRRAVAACEAIWADQTRWNGLLHSAIVADLLKLKNSDWRQRGEPKLTKADFEHRIALTAVTFSFSGDFEFWFNDGDIFWGHSISVRGDVKDGVSDVALAG